MNILPATIPSLIAPHAQAILVHSFASALLCDLYKQALSVDVAAYFKNITSIGLYACEKSGLLQYYPEVFGTESLYADLQKNPWYYMEDKAEYSHAKNYINDADSVLEIGCGAGHLATKYAFKHYTGLETNLEAQRLSKSKTVNFRAESIEIFSQSHPEQYDVVCAFQVLEHVPTPYIFLQSALSALKKGGKLILSVPNEESFSFFVPNNILNFPPHHITRWKDSALLFIKEVFGLTDASIVHMPLEPVHDNHYCNSYAFYLTCQERKTDHALLPFQEYCNIAHVAKKFIPILQHRILHKRNTIPGHDVLAIFTK